MKSMSAELKVGLFVIFVILTLSFMTFKVGGLTFSKKDGYRIYAHFDNTLGADKNTRVKLAGVNVGIIENINIVNGMAKLTMRINPGVQIHTDSLASVRALGLLGDKYVAISSGSKSAPLLKEGDTIESTKQPTDYDTLVTNLSDMSAKFAILASALNRSIGSDESQKAIIDSIKNLKLITEHLNRAITVNDRKLGTLLDRLSNLTDSVNAMVNEDREPLSNAISNFSSFSNKLKDEGPALMEEISGVAEDLRNFVADVRQPLLATAKNLEQGSSKIQSALQSISRVTDKIDKGEGTIGKLMTDDSLYNSVNKTAVSIGQQIDKVNKFKIFMEFKTENLTGVGKAKGYFNIKLQPRKERYYLFGVVQDPVSNINTSETITTENSITTSTTRTNVETGLEFTALYAGRFDDAVLKIGLIESTFGFGADYNFIGDKLTVTAEAWDFDKNEDGSQYPHIKIGADYRLTKHIMLSTGYDNLLNKTYKGLFFGGGIRFEDKDLKYLLGVLPSFTVN